MASNCPTGLLEGDAFPEPLFTPSTKADEGHDVNINHQEMVAILAVQFPDLDPEKLAMRLRDSTLEMYKKARAYALERGITIADTKFEFGVLKNGLIVACDEKLTPDSSRFWPTHSIVRGQTPPSLDKQPVRDELEASGWDKQPPPPPLSPETIQETTIRYLAAHYGLVG